MFIDKSSARIITFGSCLSRFTANQYIRLFGGSIVSSVYHNRSDAFVGRFINRDWPIIPFDEMRAKLRDHNKSDDDPDNKSINILSNQYEHGLGLHRLKNGTPLLQALDQKNADIVILDNYMDVSARLIREYPQPTNEGLFLRFSDVNRPPEAMISDDYLLPELGARNMKRIIEFFQLHLPHASIVFINFPSNTYEASENRVNRAKTYERFMKHDGIGVVPRLDIPSLFQTKDKQHFKSQQYCAYAGIVYQYSQSQQGIENIG